VIALHPHPYPKKHAGQPAAVQAQLDLFHDAA
jgi:hypothetical protein